MMDSIGKKKKARMPCNQQGRIHLKRKNKVRKGWSGNANIVRGDEGTRWQKREKLPKPVTKRERKENDNRSPSRRKGAHS